MPSATTGTRPTGDLDIWIAIHPGNAARLMVVLTKFGFGSARATRELFLNPGRVVRMGVPPVRIKMLNSVSGVDFAPCHARRVTTVLDGIPLSIIGREDLIANKRAAARPKDLNDLKQLQERKPTP